MANVYHLVVIPGQSEDGRQSEPIRRQAGERKGDKDNKKKKKKSDGNERFGSSTILNGAEFTRAAEVNR